MDLVGVSLASAWSFFVLKTYEFQRKTEIACKMVDMGESGRERNVYYALTLLNNTHIDPKAVAKELVGYFDSYKDNKKHKTGQKPSTTSATLPVGNSDTKPTNR